MPDVIEAEEVQRQMAQIRCSLDESVEDLFDSAREMTDWHMYIRRYPWACLGVAMALGYFVVPRRIEIVSPDASEIARLAKKNRIVVQDKTKAHAKAREGVGGMVLGFLANAAMRAGTAYLGQYVGKVFGQDGAAAPSAGQPMSGQ